MYRHEKMGGGETEIFTRRCNEEYDRGNEKGLRT